MDQASASPEASCAHNPVAPRTSSSCSRSVDRSRTGGPPHARSGPQCEPHAAPSNRDSRPSSPAPCRLKAKGYLLPEFYSGATGRSGRFNEGLLLRRLQARPEFSLGRRRHSPLLLALGELHGQNLASALMRSCVHNRNRDRGGKPIRLGVAVGIAPGPSGGIGGALSS